MPFSAFTFILHIGIKRQETENQETLQASCLLTFLLDSIPFISIHEWRPHEESNLDLRFRKPVFYPLNYGGESDLRTAWSLRFYKPNKV
jgi:hypothetical protein